MGIRSSPALLDSKASGDLHASQLTSCKNKSINLTQSFLQVGQEDEGNEARPSKQGWPAFYSLSASYSHGTSQASDVLHHGVHTISVNRAFQCCTLGKPIYFCPLSTQFMLNKKDCCQHPKDIYNIDLSNPDPDLAFWDCRRGHTCPQVISISLLPKDLCLSYWVYLWEGKKKVNKHKMQQKKMPNWLWQTFFIPLPFVEKQHLSI